MSNVRMKIAAGATVLGLGGLGGHALATNDQTGPSAATVAAKQKPRVRTEVVHRTIHARPHGSGGTAAGASAPAAASSPPPVAATPAVSPIAVSAPAASAPSAAPAESVSTHTSGSSGSSYSGDDGGEHERGEIESEGQDD